MALSAVRAAESFSPKSSAAGDFLFICDLLAMSSFIAGSGSDPPSADMSGILHAVQTMRQEQLLFQNSVNPLRRKYRRAGTHFHAPQMPWLVTCCTPACAAARAAPE